MRLEPGGEVDERVEYDVRAGFDELGPGRPPRGGLRRKPPRRRGRRARRRDGRRRRHRHRRRPARRPSPRPTGPRRRGRPAARRQRGCGRHWAGTSRSPPSVVPPSAVTASRAAAAPGSGAHIRLPPASISFRYRSTAPGSSSAENHGARVCSSGGPSRATIAATSIGRPVSSASSCRPCAMPGRESTSVMSRSKPTTSVTEPPARPPPSRPWRTRRGGSPQSRGRHRRLRRPCRRVADGRRCAWHRRRRTSRSRDRPPSASSSRSSGRW